MADTPKQRMTMWQQIGTLPANFWYANIMEMLERLAFFSTRAILPLYMVAAATENGLGLDFGQKGSIYAIWALIQCLVPMVSGGYTDRYGYRISLAVAFLINICGYLLMAQSLPISQNLAARGLPDANYYVLLVAACFVGFGTAVFKPPVQGTIAKVTTDETSSMGWGIFYWVVNIGGLAAPWLAATLRGETAWHFVFYAAAIVTAANFIPAFVLYREPARVRPEAGEQQRGPIGTFVYSIVQIFTDLRLVVFLLVFSCFWLMFMQLWDLLPNFIDEWVNTADVAGAFAWIPGDTVLPNGQVKPEMIINIDSAAIVVLVIFISWLISRMHKVAAMILGMIISLVGFVGSGATSIGWICCLMIFTFAIGEMICSPTFSAYIGLIAPRDKKALYMGYSNIPFAIGWALGNLVSGYMYEAYSSRANLARQYMETELRMPSAIVQNEEAMPTGVVIESLAYLLETEDRAAIEAAASSLAQLAATTTTITPEQRKAAYAEILEQVEHADVLAATEVLWEKYQPQKVWYYLGGIGLVGTIGMLFFYAFTRRSTAAAAGSTTT